MRIAQAVHFRFIGLLLVIVAHYDHGGLGRFHCPRRSRCYVESAVRGGHFADHHLAIFETQVQVLRRNNGSDGLPLHVDVARQFRFDQECLVVRLDDVTGKPVAVFEGYLIGVSAHRKDTYSYRKDQTSTHVLSPLNCRAESVVELILSSGWAQSRGINFRMNARSCTSYKAAQAYRNYFGLPTKIVARRGDLLGGT